MRQAAHGIQFAGDEVRDLVPVSAHAGVKVLPEFLLPYHFVSANGLGLRRSTASHARGGVVGGLVHVGRAISLAVKELEGRGCPRMRDKCRARVKGGIEVGETIVAYPGVQREIR